jgi:hypothetical protein
LGRAFGRGAIDCVVESLPLRALFERADPGRELTAVVIDDESSPDSPLERDEFELPLNAADAVRIFPLDTERLLGLALARGDLSGRPKTFSGRSSMSTMAAMFRPVPLACRRSTHVLDQILCGGTMPVSFSDLQLVCEFVSSGGMGENEAYLDRQSGKIYWHSEFGGNDEELPDDIDDQKYISIPDKREFDLASLWPWISLVSSCPMTTTKFATSSAEEVLIAYIRSCWCGGTPSNGGTISRTNPRRRLCRSGARRTGSTSAGPEVTLLLSTGGVDERIRPSPCSVAH